MTTVCDTNVLISGILFRGHPRRILLLASRSIIRNCISPDLLSEVDEVLRRPKFGLTSGQVDGIVELMRDTFDIVRPDAPVRAIVEDPADNRVLEAAAAASADIIVSGDRHLLALGEWKGIRIVPPAEFLELFGERHR